MPPQPNTPNNSEIDKALKEFEAESQAGQPQKYSEVSKASTISQKDVEGVKFEVPSYGAVKYYKETDVPKIVKLTMKYSGVKEQKQAEWILFGFVIVAIGISGFLILGQEHTYSKPSAIMLQQLQQMPVNVNH
jgi:hypothetical protein